MSDALTALQSVLIGPDDPEIVALEAALRTAQLGTKDQDLSAHRTGAVRVREHIPLELRIRRVSPSAALVALRTQLRVDVQGTTVRGNFRYTRVWALENGHWRIAGGHVAPSRDPTAP